MRYIKLTHKEVAQIDDEDYDKLKDITWTPIYRNSKVTSIIGWDKVNRQQVSLARVIMNPSKGMQVDHINRNPLDNRKSNLRICTPAQNMVNRRMAKRGVSGYVGVLRSPLKSSPVWKSQIVHNYETIVIGYFNDVVAAAKAYDQKAINLRGEFAVTNFNYDK